MKDHIQERRLIYLEGPIDLVIDDIRSKAGGLIDPKIELDYGYDYEGDTYSVMGWRPMNEIEIGRARRAAETARKSAKTAKAKREKDERANAVKLLKKYPDIINDL